jgi:4-cresol dehydrogenase (hydroxylating)
MDNFQSALNQWVAALGQGNVLSESEGMQRYSMNVTEYAPKQSSAVLMPSGLQQVQALVSIANEFKQPLYPFSTGKNWGLGSRIPTSDNCALVDLKRMNKIIEVNERLRYAVIEPGVTQQNLSDALKIAAPSLLMHMTGSGCDTSICGNILERGVGVLGSRYDNLIGMEIVLGNGDVVRTGFWHFNDGAKAEHYYAPGVGADLRGLFSQSNLGIVTKMVVKLNVKKRRKVMNLKAQERHLSTLSDQLFYLREAGVLKDGLIITGMNDPRTSAGQSVERGVWFASASIDGTPAMMDAAEQEVRIQLDGLFESLEFIDTDHPIENPDPEYLKVIMDMYNGVPTNYALETMCTLGGVELGQNELDLDLYKKVPGFVCALPAVPFEGSKITQIIAALDEIAHEIQVQPYYNFVGIAATALEGFFRVFFDRADPEAVQKAHAWNALSHEKLAEMGYYPYRANVEQMPTLFDNREDAFWKTLFQIKSALDPNHIMAPGNYCPRPVNYKQTN